MPSSRSRAQSCCSSTGAVHISPPSCRRSTASAPPGRSCRCTQVWPDITQCSKASSPTSPNCWRCQRAVRRIGIEAATTGAVIALINAGYHVVDAAPPIDYAKARKVPGEIDLILSSLRCTELGVRAMEHELVPGITENELWAVLHEAVIAGGGDHQTRLLNSGPRTNPWFQEASIGPSGGRTNRLRHRRRRSYGYFSDFSRISSPTITARPVRNALPALPSNSSINIAAPFPGSRFVSTRALLTIPDGYREHRYMGPAPESA